MDRTAQKRARALSMQLGHKDTGNGEIGRYNARPQRDPRGNKDATSRAADPIKPRGIPQTFEASLAEGSLSSRDNSSGGASFLRHQHINAMIHKLLG